MWCGAGEYVSRLANVSVERCVVVVMLLVDKVKVKVVAVGTDLGTWEVGL